MYDILLACQSDYLNKHSQKADYEIVLEEQEILIEALSAQGLSSKVVGWENQAFDWSTGRLVLVRETWNYSGNLGAYMDWLTVVSEVAELANPSDTLLWNIDKFYLRDLSDLGVNIPDTVFLEKGTDCTLASLQQETGWEQMVMKPAVAATARETYRLDAYNLSDHEEKFRRLVSGERMLFQKFQNDVIDTGERTLVMIDGEYSHAVIKKAVPGDFRVQSDFGGSAQVYEPTKEEIDFAFFALDKLSPLPVYARIDVITDDRGQLAMQELELIEPELWFRFHEGSADRLARALKRRLENN